METLFERTGGQPASIISVELASWQAPVPFSEVLYALAVLHNRLLALRKYKGDVKKGQLLHPAAYLAADERLAVRSYPSDGRPLELLAYPAVARTLAAFLHEVAAAAPAEVSYTALITLFKNELELLAKRHYREEQVRRLLKLDVLGAALGGARVTLDESPGGEQ